jgi:hypothetical protein
MKQTAVEWLYKALLLDEDNPNYNQRVFNQAKEMEKEQIIQFANDWYEDYCEGSGYFKYPKDYYNETFKSE